MAPGVSVLHMAPMRTHGWLKEGDAHVARVAVGDLVQFELRVTATAWALIVDGVEKRRGVSTTPHGGRREALDELDLRLREATAKTEAWLFEILRRG